MTTYRLLAGDVRETLATLPDASVQCVVTSPPYWGLRDYGTARWEGGDPSCEHRGSVSRTAPPGTSKQASNHGGNDVRSGDCLCGACRIDAQLGLEPTPAEYVTRMVEVFAQVHRVLRDDGTLWLNLGDSYCGYWGDATAKKEGRASSADTNGWTNGFSMNAKPKYETIRHTGIKPKDLVGIPWLVAFALRDYGWYLRSEIIWHKPNPMPESVTDRPTKAHEYLFLLTKSARYYYDAAAIAEPADVANHRPSAGIRATAPGSQRHGGPASGARSYVSRNKRTVWTVATQPYAEAHFATYPEALIEPCILAGSREGDTVLDPFNGSGTTGAVSVRHRRHYIGCELNPEYIALARERIGAVAPLFAIEQDARARQMREGA